MSRETDHECRWVPLGYFRLESAEQGNPPDGPIGLSGSDRMAGIVSNLLLPLAPWLIAQAVRRVWRRMTGRSR